MMTAKDEYVRKMSYLVLLLLFGRNKNIIVHNKQASLEQGNLKYTKITRLASLFVKIVPFSARCHV